MMEAVERLDADEGGEMTAKRMSPEERAEALYDDEAAWEGVRVMPDMWVALVASVIRAAEQEAADEALERAAQEVEVSHLRVVLRQERDSGQDVAQLAARRIRSLKSTPGSTGGRK